ncbi:porin [Pseudomonas aeruginosa]
MNKNNTAVRRILPLTLASLGALGGLQPAAADILLYDKDETTFSTDGYFNAFYVNSDVDRQGETYDRRQSRVKMGFLPNYIGFNFGRKVDELSLGGRASFWVTINDSETDGTDTAIDVRQFYGTVAGDWGEVLIGKDFGLFSRSNIFLDELLAGFGNPSDTLGLVDGKGVSFGNIGTGYPYPFPTSQITYRNNNLLPGLRIAVGILDPIDSNQIDKDASDGLDDKAYQDNPRYESEVSYQFDLAGAQFRRLHERLGPPLLTIGCDCFLRRLELEVGGDTQATAAFLRSQQVIGFNTYGEQFNGMHINQTFTGVAIGRPRGGVRR